MSADDNDPKNTLAAQGAKGKNAFDGALLDPSRRDDLVAWCTDCDIDASVILLAGEIVHRRPDAPEFLNSLVSVYPPDGRAREITRRWLLWLWREASPSIHSYSAHGAIALAVDKAMDMHRRTLDGETIGAKGWRAARKDLSLPAPDRRSQIARDTVLASLWDWATTQAAGADVAKTWLGETVLMDAIEAANWSWENYSRHIEAVEDIQIASSGKKREDGESREEFNRRRVLLAKEKYRQIPAETIEKAKSVAYHRERLMAERVADMKQALLDITASA